MSGFHIQNPNPLALLRMNAPCCSANDAGREARLWTVMESYNSMALACATKALDLDANAPSAKLMILMRGLTAAVGHKDRVRHLLANAIRAYGLIRPPLMLPAHSKSRVCRRDKPLSSHSALAAHSSSNLEVIWAANIIGVRRRLPQSQSLIFAVTPPLAAGSAARHGYW